MASKRKQTQVAETCPKQTRTSEESKTEDNPIVEYRKSVTWEIVDSKFGDCITDQYAVGPICAIIALYAMEEKSFKLDSLIYEKYFLDDGKVQRHTITNPKIVLAKQDDSVFLYLTKDIIFEITHAQRNSRYVYFYFSNDGEIRRKFQFQLTGNNLSLQVPGENRANLLEFLLGTTYKLSASREVLNSILCQLLKWVPYA